LNSWGSPKAPFGFKYKAAIKSCSHAAIAAGVWMIGTGSGALSITEEVNLITILL
jgi:hypothetical protein